jgi:hypothetical protein
MAEHDEIEFNEPTYTTCECCGTTRTGLVRYVYREGSWIGIYYASFSEAPEHDWINLLVALGDLSKDSPVEHKAAFALQMWTDGENNHVRVAEPEDIPWDTDYFGPILTRAEGLAHPWLQEVFDLTDHMMLCDEPIIAFLDRSDPSGRRTS